MTFEPTTFDESLFADVAAQQDWWDLVPTEKKNQLTELVREFCNLNRQLFQNKINAGLNKAKAKGKPLGRRPWKNQN